MYLHDHFSVIYSSEDMEATQASINKWVDEEVVHTYDGILFSHEKSEILPFVTWVEPEGIMRSEISQTEKDKYHMI